MKRKLMDIPYIRFSIYFWLLMTLNFFITPNPYSAIHSGGSGAASGIISTSFTLNQLYLLLFAVLLSILYQKYVILSPVYLGLIAIMWISGIVTGALFSNMVTYIYNSVMTLGIASFAHFSSTLENSDDYFSEDKLLKIGDAITLLTIFGLVLAIIRPNVWGLLSLAFNRSQRGEITYWLIFGLQVLVPSLAMVIFEKTGRKRYLIVAFIVWVLILASSKRNYTVVAMLPVIYYFLIRKKDAKKIAFGFVGVAVLFYFSDEILSFFTLGSSSNTLSDVLNGRYELWVYYFQSFLEKPLFGNGAGFLTRATDYTGYATSEVGLLKWYGEYGLFYGLILTILVIRACVIAIRMLRINETDTFTLLVSYVYLSLVILVFQSFSRVLEYPDSLFWFGMIYLNFKGNITMNDKLLVWGRCRSND